jgi:hypothetical protein
VLTNLERPREGHGAQPGPGLLAGLLAGLVDRLERRLVALLGIDQALQRRKRPVLGCARARGEPIGAREARLQRGQQPQLAAQDVLGWSASTATTRSLSVISS